MIQRSRGSLQSVLETPQNKSYFMISITIAVVVVFTVFAIVPVVTTVFELNEKIEKGEAVSQQMSQKITNLNSLRSDMFRLENQIIKADQSLPESSRVDIIIASLELIAEKFDLELTSLAPSEEGEINQDQVFIPAGLGAQALSALFVGSEDDVIAFLDQIENLPRQIDVQSITYRVIDVKEPEQKQITMQIIYYFKL